MPDFGSLLADSYAIAAAVVGLGVLLTMGWWYVGLSDREGDVQVALINFGQPGIDNIFMQLLLFFETEDFSRFLRQHPSDTIKGRVVKIGIEGGDGGQWQIPGPGQAQSGQQAAVGPRRTIDGHYNRAVAE